MGMGFQFEQHRLGLWDLSWDLKKTISWEMGLGPPLHDPQIVIEWIRMTFTATTEGTPDHSTILFSQILSFSSCYLLFST